MHIRTTYSSHTAHSAVTGCSLTVPTLVPQDSPGLAIDEEQEHQDAMAAMRVSYLVGSPIRMDRRKRARNAPGIGSKLGSPGLTRRRLNVQWARRMGDFDQGSARGLPDWRDHPGGLCVFGIRWGALLWSPPPRTASKSAA